MECVNLKIFVKSAAFGLTILFLSLLLPHSAWAEQVDGGLPGRSEQEIMEKWNQWMNDKDKNIPMFTETPSTQAPYSPGILNPAYLQRGLDAANFYRFLSGLNGDLVLDEALNHQAQYGAVLVSTEGRLNHHPKQPADMADDFYKVGYKSTSSSNLYTSNGDGNILVSSIEAYMDDSGVTNIDRVGHRRWILSPKLQKIGFGIADNDDYYSAMQVMDTSRSSNTSYNYSLYPNKGAFPVEAFNALEPWSVQLNPDQFQKPSLNDVRVKITRLADQKMWSLDHSSASEGFPTAYYNVSSYDLKWHQQAYLNVNTTNFGYGYAIIFRPDDVQLIKAGDQFQVTITGLNKTDGTPAEISYQTNFFNIHPQKQSEEPYSISTDQSEISIKVGEEVELPVIKANYQNQAGLVVKSNLNSSSTSDKITVSNGKIRGLKAGTAKIQVSYKGQTLMLTVKVSDVPHVTDIQSHWASEAIQWAIHQQMVNGFKDGTFRPNQLVTEAEFLSMLFSAYPEDFKDSAYKEAFKDYNKGVWSDRYYMYAGSYNLDVNSRIKDVKLRNKVINRAEVAQIVAGLSGRNYAKNEDAILYLLNMGYSTGKTSATVEGYGGKENLTRAEAVAFLKNLKEQGYELWPRPNKPTPVTDNERNGGLPENTVKAVYKAGKLILKGTFSEAANKSISIKVHGPVPLVKHIQTQSVTVDKYGNFSLEVDGMTEESLNIYIYPRENYAYQVPVKTESATVISYHL